MKLDLEDRIPGSTHFKWKEFLLLRSADMHVFPRKIQYDNIVKTVSKLEIIRNIFKSPIHITSGLRPEKYNVYIGGAHRSKHITGEAVDFVVEGYQGGTGCNKVRLMLLQEIDNLQIRIENKPDSNWIHIDLGYKKEGRNYFRP